jgi:hypothetical protein
MSRRINGSTWQLTNEGNHGGDAEIRKVTPGRLFFFLDQKGEQSFSQLNVPIYGRKKFVAKPEFYLIGRHQVSMNSKQFLSLLLLFIPTWWKSTSRTGFEPETHESAHERFPSALFHLTAKETWKRWC